MQCFFLDSENYVDMQVVSKAPNYATVSKVWQDQCIIIEEWDFMR